MRSTCGVRGSGTAQVLHRAAAAIRACSSAAAPLRRLPLAAGHTSGDGGVGSLVASRYCACSTSARFRVTVAATSSSTPAEPAPSPPGMHPTETAKADRAAAVAAAPTELEGRFCSLCDASFDSWQEHSTENAHVARAVVCRFFVMPERSESIMQHLERHIALDLREVDALALRKVQRRRTRLLAGMLHLVEEGVLRDSIPELVGKPPSTDTVRGITAAALNVHADNFMKDVLLGEAVMRREVLDRCARLMPTLMAHELHSVATYLTTPRQLARVFDELALLDLLVARPGAQPESGTRATPEGSGEAAAQAAPAAAPRWTLTRENKSLIVCACLGELHCFHDRTRPRSVANKEAADAIVLHVLAGHARENLIAELVHDALQRIVDEGTVVWRRFQEEARHHARSPARPDVAAADEEGGGAGAAGCASWMDPRCAQLAAHPTPPPAATEQLAPGKAAGRCLLASYFPFRDVGGPVKDAATAAPAQGDEAATAAAAAAPSLADPEFISATHSTGKHWEPLQLDMRLRAAAWRSLDVAPSSPFFTAIKTKKHDT